MKTVVIELRNNNALQLLKDLESADLIRILKTDKKEVINPPGKLRGSISKERAKEINHQIDLMRNEWTSELSHDVIYFTRKSKSFSVVQLNTKDFKFNRDEANER